MGILVSSLSEFDRLASEYSLVRVSLVVVSLVRSRLVSRFVVVVVYSVFNTEIGNKFKKVLVVSRFFFFFSFAFAYVLSKLHV